MAKRVNSQQNQSNHRNQQGQKKVVKLRKPLHLQIGHFLFLLIIAYVAFSFVSFKQRDQVKYYEVEEGSIVRENTYRGLILREERVVDSEGSGYLNYFIPEGKKVAKGGRVYAIDTSGNLKNYISEHASQIQEMSAGNLAALRTDLTNFSKQYSDADFQSVAQMNAQLNAQVMEYASLSLLGSLSDELANAGISFNAYSSDSTGTVSYVIDGYEDMTLTDVDAAVFSDSSYQRQLTEAGKHIDAGEPAYKLITSENWMLVFPVDAKDLSEFSDKSRLRIRFPEKEIETVADFQTIKGSDGNSFGVLSLTKYLIQFESQRFLDFEIISNDVSGLKIPDKSITTKDFYVIPTEYLATDENGNLGFYKAVVSDAGTSQQFIQTDIYNNDGTECYIECTDETSLKPGDYVTKEGNSDRRYQIATTKPLEGVYNINKGYTVFKRIELLESANGYSIIKKNSSYGLSVYDHIVLDASTVGDGQILYR